MSSLLFMDCLLLIEDATHLHNVGNWLYHSTRLDVPEDLNLNVTTSLCVIYKEHLEAFCVKRLVRVYN